MPTLICTHVHPAPATTNIHPRHGTAVVPHTNFGIGGAKFLSERQKFLSPIAEIST